MAFMETDAATAGRFLQGALRDGMATGIGERLFEPPPCSLAAQSASAQAFIEDKPA